ncbi:hypothetical protein LTR66_000831 [Elasticomyces elasticus]|nr:hypothetical protein LTR66_000831 [Elasticomyces elasticus]
MDSPPQSIIKGSPRLTPVGAAEVTIALVVGGWFLKLLYTALTSPLKHLPGPWYTRFTHLRLKLAVVTGQRIFYIDDLHKRYGPVVRLTPTEVGIADVESFQQIHKVGTRFLKSDWYQRLANFPKPGIFTMVDAKEHGYRRRLLSRPFSRTHLVEHWELVVKAKAELCIAKIKAEAKEGKADVFKWWMLLASDIIGHISFGESFHMLEMGEKTKFLRVLEKLTKGAGIMVEMPLLRILSFVPITGLQEMFNANQYILESADRAVELAHSASGEANTFARMLADAEKDEGHMDDMDVRIEAMNFIIAGTDTTGSTLTYLVWAVLSRPALQQELEEEVSRLPANYRDSDMLALPLLNATIDETLRLYGAAPSSLPRVVPQGGATLSGQFIPEGTTVCTQAYTLHRDPTIWRDPLTFHPTRWLPGKEMPQAAKTAFHPFGAGARICAGIHLARMELRHAVAEFFRECRGIELCKSVTPESMEIINFFLIAPKGHKCEITLRSDE